jgi:hypothetical protein
MQVLAHMSPKMNVLVSNQGVIKISDFGNSVLEECSLGFTATVTIGGGSLRWMVCRFVNALQYAFN